MKEAMWALAMLVLGLFGVVLVNLFGNITVTDQLNYTTMKNAVESAMYDSLDVAHYRTGFCLCTNKQKNEEGKWVFISSNEYRLDDIQFDENNQEKCEIAGYSNCEILHGEYRIKPKTFSESLVRRFAEMVNNNKDYSIVIQDIIEYPPKVSVKIVSKDAEYSPTEENSDGYVITNEIDGIIETQKDPTPEPAPPITPEPTTEPTVPPSITQYKVVTHHVKKEENSEKVANDITVAGDEENYVDTVCPADAYDTNKLYAKYRNNYSWDGTKPSGVPSGFTYNSETGCVSGTLTGNIELTYKYEQDVSRIIVKYIANVPSGTGVVNKKICDYVTKRKIDVNGNFTAVPCELQNYKRNFYYKASGVKHAKYERDKSDLGLVVEGITSGYEVDNDRVTIRKAQINQASGDIVIKYYYNLIQCKVITEYFALDSGGSVLKKDGNNVYVYNSSEITKKIGESFSKTAIPSGSLKTAYKRKYDVVLSKTKVVPAIEGAIKDNGETVSATISDVSMCDASRNIKVQFYYQKKAKVIVRHYSYDKTVDGVPVAKTENGNPIVVCDRETINTFYGSRYSIDENYKCTKVGDENGKRKLKSSYSNYTYKAMSVSSGTVNADEVYVDFFYEKTGETSGSCKWHNNAIRVECKKASYTTCATTDYDHNACDYLSGTPGFDYCKSSTTKCASCPDGYDTTTSGNSCVKNETIKTYQTEAHTGYDTCALAQNNCETQAAALAKLCPEGTNAMYSCNGYQTWESILADGGNGSSYLTCAKDKPVTGTKCPYENYKSCLCYG